MIERGLASTVFARVMDHRDATTTERKYIHLFNRQRTDDQVREAVQSARLPNEACWLATVSGTKKMPDSDGDTLGLATLRTAVSVRQEHSFTLARRSQARVAMGLRPVIESAVHG